MMFTVESVPQHAVRSPARTTENHGTLGTAPR